MFWKEENENPSPHLCEIYKAYFALIEKFRLVEIERMIKCLTGHHIGNSAPFFCDYIETACYGTVRKVFRCFHCASLFEDAQLFDTNRLDHLEAKKEYDKKK